MNIFGFDGKFYRIGTVLADILLIGLLWTIFSLPIITMGATTTALYYVCTKKASGKDGYIFKEFLKSFKDNFVQSTSVFLLLILLSYIVWLNLRLLGMEDMERLGLPVTIALYFLLLQIIMIATHVFCIIARFETTVFKAMKSALYMAYRHLFSTITSLVLLLAIVFVALSLPELIIFMMGIYIYFSSSLFVKMFRKHYPDFDEVASDTTTLE